MIDVDAGALWFYVLAVLVVYGLVVAALLAEGDGDAGVGGFGRLLARMSSGASRFTGLSGWAGAGAMTALWAGAAAAIGLYWDVAWHVDNGRDDSVLTPSHTLILMGLGGLVFAGMLAIMLATVERDQVGVRFGPLQVPWTALALVGLGVGAVAAFPLDALWHNAYGIDVTLWSPTHLQLVAGGGLGPLAAWLMLREGRAGGRPTPFGRGLEVAILGAALVGLSAFQGEFDFGVPQFQAAYLPLLVAVAGGMALVLARIAYGPGGALWVVGVFVLLRTCLAVMVSGALAHTTPRFPLYLAAGLCVEGVAWLLGTEKGMRFALVSGALVGTVGVAGEMAWVQLSGWAPVSVPPPAALVGLAVLGLVAAVAGAVLGLGLAQAAAPGTGFSVAAGAGALVALVAVLAVPFPRNVGSVDAAIRLEPAGDKAFVEVDLTPADAAASATAFGVTAWQGGGPRVTSAMREVGPGRYVSEMPLPISGNWKTVVGLNRGSEVMAAPVYLPADPGIGAPEIPALPERRTSFVRNTDLLLRESRPGPAWVANVSYMGVALVALTWIGLLGLVTRRVGEAASAAESSTVASAGFSHPGRIAWPDLSGSHSVLTS